MAVRIGYQSYGWYNYRQCNDLIIPLDQILTEMRDAGFRHIELCSPTEELGTPSSLNNTLDTLGLTLHALTGRIDGGLINWTKERIDFLHEVGGEIMVINAGWIEPGEAKTEDRYQALAAGLEELSEYGLPRGVQVTYHNHLGTICETPDEIERLFSLLEKTRYCIDTGHLAAAGGDVIEMIQRHADRIVYGHLKDAAIDVDTAEYVEFVDLSTGNVGLDVREVIDTLDAVGFDGWMMVEQDHTGTTPFESARRNAQTLRELGIAITE